MNWSEQDVTTQLIAGPDAVRLDFWTNPKGIEVEGDPLNYLYVTDAAEHLLIAELAKRVTAYQDDPQVAGNGDQVDVMIMIMMGALLPGSVLADHLKYGYSGFAGVEWGTVGIEFYRGPGDPLEDPRVLQQVTVSVREKVVGLVEDLGDMGRSILYTKKYLEFLGAKKVLPIMLYIKPLARELLVPGDVVYVGVVPQDTWIITPRERVETLRRAIYWRDALGFTTAQIKETWLRVGYPEWMLQKYLPAVTQS